MSENQSEYGVCMDETLEYLHRQIDMTKYQINENLIENARLRDVLKDLKKSVYRFEKRRQSYPTTII